MPRPSPRDIPIACPACRLLDFYISHNEASGQTVVRCQNCREPFIQINYVPAETPDPAVII